MNRSLLCVFAAAAFLASGCGKNITDASAGTSGPPQNLVALSVNDSTVALQWSAAPGDSALTGYLVQYGTVRDTIPKSQLAFTAAPLARGMTVFQVFSLLSDGTRSAAATIQWATASRFDSPFVLVETDNANPNKISGLHVGDRLTDPVAMAMNDPAAPASMDLFLYELPDQTLLIRSANLFVGIWNHTLFSTERDTSTSLNRFSSSFPAANTFTLDNVPVVDNTIYYAQVTGQPGETNYVRLFVRDLGGNSPNRSISIRISLQRVPGLQFAARSVVSPSAVGPLALLSFPH